MKKKFLPMLLALAIVLGLLPLAVFAAGSTTAADGTVIAVAPLVDNSGVLDDAELYTPDTYTVELTDKEITLSAKQLVPHQNGSEIMGYWAGVSFTPAGNKSINGYKIGTASGANDYASISATASLYIYFDVDANSEVEEAAVKNTVYSTVKSSVTIHYTDGTADTYTINTDNVEPYTLADTVKEEDIKSAKEASAWVANSEKKQRPDGTEGYDPFTVKAEKNGDVFEYETNTDVLGVLAANDMPYMVDAGDTSDETDETGEVAKSFVTFDSAALNSILGEAAGTNGAVKVQMKSDKSGEAFNKLVSKKPATATPKKSFSINVTVGDQNKKVTNWDGASGIKLDLYIGGAPAQGNMFKLFYVADDGTWDPDGFLCTPSSNGKSGYFHVEVNHLSDYVAAEVAEGAAPAEIIGGYVTFTEPAGTYLTPGYVSLSVGKWLEKDGTAKVGVGEVKEGDYYLVQIKTTGGTILTIMQADASGLMIPCNKTGELSVWQIGSTMTGYPKLTPENLQGKQVVYQADLAAMKAPAA